LLACFATILGTGAGARWKRAPGCENSDLNLSRLALFDVHRLHQQADAMHRQKPPYKRRECPSKQQALNCFAFIGKLRF
jgi:hypothetical protein